MNFHSNGVAIVEVVRAEHLALADAEVDLDLVVPAGMDGQVDEAQVPIGVLESLDRRLAAVEEPPKSLARWTSQAAKYWSAPPRSYSC